MAVAVAGLAAALFDCVMAEEEEEDGLDDAETTECGAGVDVWDLRVFVFFGMGRTGLMRDVDRRGNKELFVIPLLFVFKVEERDDDFMLDCEDGCEDDAEEEEAMLSTWRYFFSVGVRVSWKLKEIKKAIISNGTIRWIPITQYLAQ